jgi:hypothetical protein
VTPTFEELMQLAEDYFTFRGNTMGDSFFATALTAKADPATSLEQFARAVLARYGHPALAPIPVFERLPEAEDCDAEVAKLARLLREEVRELRDSGSMGHLTLDERLRAADILERLAQPEPVGPTDEELMEQMPQHVNDDFAAAARALAGPGAPKAVAGACRVGLNRNAVDFARAVLARWGRPASALPLPKGGAA